jgi:hypothetical protein
MRFLNTNTAGASAVTIDPTNPTLNTGSLAKGMIFKLPMTSKWMQSSTILSELSSKHSHETINGNPVVGTQFTTFDGTGDYLSYNDRTTLHYNFTNTGNFSISFWIKTASTSVALINRRSSKGYVCQISSGGYMDFFMNDGVNRNCISTTMVVNDNKWHNLIWIFNKDLSPNRYMYVDGALQSATQTAIMGDFAGGALNLNIAANQIGGSLLIGSMRDVFIWNRALTTAEISLLTKSS